MGSINLLFTGEDELAAQKQHRQKCLWVMFFGFAMGCVALMMFSTFVSQQQNHELDELYHALAMIDADYEALKMYQTHLEEKNAIACQNEMVGRLFKSPVRGVQMISLTLEDKVRIQGRAKNLLAFKNFRQLLGQWLVLNTWSENQGVDAVHFQIEGALAC